MSTAMVVRSRWSRPQLIAIFALLQCIAVTSARASDPIVGPDPLNNPALRVELGPEQVVARGAGWPYLFQSREGTTVVFGHVRWIPKQPHPIVFTTRSFDARKTWQPWIPSPEQGEGPVTEGAVVQLKDGRIMILDVYAYHQANKVFAGKRWFSNDGWKTVTGPDAIQVSVPQVKIDGLFDDRGEPIARLYIRRSVIELGNGDLLASAYGVFEEDAATKVEYLAKMRQHRSYLIRSNDGGKNWSYLSTIAAPVIGQEGPGEPVLLQLKRGTHAGRLICQLRVGREHAVWQTESNDEGRTWTKSHALNWTYSRFGRTRELVGVDPDLIEMSDGTLVMSYGHKPDYMDHGNFLAFSLDQGETWICETRLNTSMTVAYTGVREISPGTLFVVYSTTSEPNAFNYKAATFDTVGRTVTIKRNRPVAGK